MDQGIDLRQLRAFITVAETGNVTRSAEMLNLVQPAVSRQLKLLEQDIGTPLFERERHGMVLTDAGRALLGYARRAMLELQRARAEISGSQDGIGGLASIGLLPSTAEVLSSAFVRAVAERYPGIRIRIATGYAGTLRQWLESGEVDAALLYGAEQSPSLRSRPLIEEALWVVGPPSAKLRRNRPMPLASLAGRPMVLPSTPHGIRALVDHAFATARIELCIAAETNALNVQRSLVLGGHGLTILPAIAVAGDLQARTLSAAPLTAPIITRTIVLALPTQRSTGRHIERAVDLLVACARSAVTDGRWLDGRWLGA